MRHYSSVSFLALVAGILLLPTEAYSLSRYEQCLLEAATSGGDEVQLSEIRTLCGSATKPAEEESPASPETEPDTDSDPDAVEVEEPSPIEKRIAVESLAQTLPFLLVPHKTNYLLPITYNDSPNPGPFIKEDLPIDRAEVKFQLSIKSRIVKGLFFDHGDLWFGYTNISFWQAYNTDRSAPFRESNHEPEFFLDFQPALSFAGWQTNLLRFGGNHQSNGRSGSLSRSWNRVYALVTAEKRNWVFGVKPWYRIREGTKDDPEKSDGDDNPDIHKFLGYGELFAYYQGDANRLGVMLRNNLSGNNRMSLQVDWTFPLNERLRGYVQYFNGYGESLIDYNDSVNRIGLGIVISEDH